MVLFVIVSQIALVNEGHSDDQPQVLLFREMEHY